MIELKFTGPADAVLAEMQTFIRTIVAAAPAVSEVSSDKAPPADEQKAEKPKRGRPPKTVEPQREPPAEDPQDAMKGNTPPAEQPKPVEISVDDVRQVVGEYVTKHGLDTARQDIATMMAKAAPGVANIGALADATPDVRRAVYEAVKAAVDAGTRLVEAA